MNIKEFLAFTATRPDEERWELIEGVAVLMTPPTLAHNRIASNLHFIFGKHFRELGADLYPYGESGVRIPQFDNFLPQPDFIVAPIAAAKDIYSDKFRLVAEVISPSNRKREIAIKLARYKEHALCDHVLIIESQRVRLELHDRAAGWQPRVFAEPQSLVTLGAFGLSFRLADLYYGTSLAG
jgi:Uma2 family endonuclease